MPRVGGGVRGYVKVPLVNKRGAETGPAKSRPADSWCCKMLVAFVGVTSTAVLILFSTGAVTTERVLQRSSDVDGQSPPPASSAVVVRQTPPGTVAELPSTMTQRAVAPGLRPCPTKGAVTVQVAGRLGNQMWQYATTWATARKTGLEPFVPRSLRRTLDKIFRDLSVPPVEVISHCHVNWTNSVKSPYDWKKRPGQNVFLPIYPFYETFVLQWVDELRRVFTFHDELLQASHDTLRSIGNSSGATTYVGVHVRRTDYGHHLWIRGREHLASSKFFLDAMAYFKAKYRDDVVFVVTSDDPIWCQQNLAKGSSDVFIAGGSGLSTPEKDLALMAACNHSILDYGTFGCWGAILANGETIVYNLSVSVETSMIAAKLIPNWRVMD
ncbi:hypothetical protein PR048_008311 [Dryococelus australis]|uniref:L-Fucosyltransferase n=1 Tax=Dryococelus australis TaxID=614101 RepID=A0ABQ9HX26_9NEOP|nr:hypothetical protein PR048_008311 [Dryococelus australis]